jgi:DNA-binding NarL/FixJ family response regulator
MERDMLTLFIGDESDEVRKRLVNLVGAIPGVELTGQAGNALAAIAGIGAATPEVAILDVHMPGGNGIQALGAVKALASPPIVIMLTAFPYPQYRQRCLVAGADYFFDKATQFEELVELLEEMVRAKRDLHLEAIK